MSDSHSFLQEVDMGTPWYRRSARLAEQVLFYLVVVAVVVLYFIVLSHISGAVNAAPDTNSTPALDAYNKGLVYDSLGEISNAASAYQIAVSYDPDFAEAWYNLGMDYYALSDKLPNCRDLAYDCFTKARELGPELNAWSGKDGLPMQVNSNSDWEQWKRIHALEKKQ